VQSICTSGAVIRSLEMFAAKVKLVVMKRAQTVDCRSSHAKLASHVAKHGFSSSLEHTLLCISHRLTGSWNLASKTGHDTDERNDCHWVDMLRRLLISLPFPRVSIAPSCSMVLSSSEPGCLLWLRYQRRRRDNSTGISLWDPDGCNRAQYSEG
jgi:hypothetical protein